MNDALSVVKVTKIVTKVTEIVIKIVIGHIQQT